MHHAGRARQHNHGAADRRRRLWACTACPLSRPQMPARRYRGDLEADARTLTAPSPPITTLQA